MSRIAWNPPTRVPKRKLEKFKTFLVARGAELLTTTNEYEVLRIRTADGVHILYQKKSGQLTWDDELIKAYKAYSCGSLRWSAGNKSKRRKNLSVKLRSVLKRDGHTCFYCNAEFNDDCPPTTEHLLPVAHGGNDHISNLAAACVDCNNAVGHMSLVEKIKYREHKRYGSLEAQLDDAIAWSGEMNEDEIPPWEDIG